MRAELAMGRAANCELWDAIGADGRDHSFPRYPTAADVRKRLDEVTRSASTLMGFDSYEPAESWPVADFD